jgi:superfamily II DNA or RNA helicase
MVLSKALLSPGPDLVIVDEAHGVFNKEGKKIDPIISLMRAPRRIALTGT